MPMKTSRNLLFHRLLVTAGLWSAFALTSLGAPAKEGEGAGAAGKSKSKKNDLGSHQWVNDVPERMIVPGLKHRGFFSPTNKALVGYCVYLPPGYEDPVNEERKYPVVYMLHGGRPGSELKLVPLLEFIHPQMASGEIPPMIYVFVNGGAMSHYDYPKLNSYGESAFIKELIPQIDANYRTFKNREGRALEGGSQGGRGTARHMFKYPELFVSNVPMFGGHQHEKRISESEGRESETIVFEAGNNTYDLARQYAKNPVKPFHIMVVVGDKDFNYEANLDWMAHLESLKIAFKKKVVADASHSAREVYEKAGLAIMKFHARNFRNALGSEW